MMRFGWLYCEARKRRDESRWPAGFEPGSPNARFSSENDGALFISCRPTLKKIARRPSEAKTAHYSYPAGLVFASGGIMMVC